MFLYNSNGKVGMGLIVAILGLLTNSWFWIKYKKILNENYNSIINGQYKVYRAKAAIDLCIVIALSSVALFPTASFTKYVDAFGSIVVSIYLFYFALENKNK